MSEVVQGEPPPPLNVVVPQAQQAGVWSNLAMVSHTEHEFTIDYVRRDTIIPNQAIVVARVSMSPLMINQLRESLEENWNEYAKKALPKEVYDDEQQEQSDGGSESTS